MPYRIIYCALSCASLLTQAPHDTVRPLDDGVVAAVSDEVMGTLLDKDPGLPILYFSRDSYNRAVRGLKPEEIDEALRKRLKQWSPDALSDSLNWIDDDERRVLSLVARERLAATGEKAKTLETHFNEGLDLLALMTSTRRYDRAKLIELMQTIEEDDGLLIAELSPSSEAGTRTEFVHALGREMARYGRTEFVDSLPHAEPRRGVWVSPADEAVEAYVKAREMNWLGWRGGVLLWLSKREIEMFRKDGKTVEILYFDGDALVEVGGPPTKAQLDLRLEEASKANADTRARLKDDYLNTLRLVVALKRRFLRKRALTEDREMSQLLDRQVAEETDILAKELARSSRWLWPGDRTSKPGEVIAAEKDLLADAAFFMSLARRRGGAGLIGEIVQLVQDAKERDLRRLADIKD